MNKFCLIVLVTLAFEGVGGIALSKNPAKASSKRIACYYESWAVYRPGKGIFDIINIDPNLCDIGLYAFAGLNAATNTIISLDPYNDLYVGYGMGGFLRFTGLTEKNPYFIPMLSVGGWNEGSISYSKMASSAESRKSFIDSAIEFLDKYGFKGLDLDWEYPGARGGRPEDKQNYVQLLKELREAFDPLGYYLSAAVSAGKENIDNAYDIPNVAKYLHFINLMAYDYHGDWEPYVGMNAPLYARPDENNGNEQLNVDFSVNYWITNGAPADKINLGLGAYGRTFTLADPLKHNFYDASTGPGEAGPYTEEAGDIGYNEICEAMMKHVEWPVTVDQFYLAPYTYHENQWIGYDDVTSIREKCEYANNLNLGGVMLWSIDTDDFLGTCGSGKYPLLTVVNEVIHGGFTHPPAPTTTPFTGSTPSHAPTHHPTTKPPAPTFEPDEVCKKPGFQADPNDCSVFYNCVLQPDGTWVVYRFTCENGLVFDPSIDSCNFSENVPDCHADI